MEKNGVVEETGLAAGVLGHPAAGIAWLANKLAPHGEFLVAGELLLAGSFTRPVAAATDMERTAYFLTAWKLGKYYRTYPAYVEDEVKSALDAPDSQFVRGPYELTSRGTATDDRAAFVVEDGRYVSARWPGDAYLFAKKFLERVEG